jgi:hypothetical protein
MADWAGAVQIDDRADFHIFAVASIACGDHPTTDPGQKWCSPVKRLRLAMLVNRSSDYLRVAAVPRAALLTACARYGIRSHPRRDCP